MSETRFPLDAEQIVRLVAWAMAKHVDAVRPIRTPVDGEPAQVITDPGTLAVELGEFVGVNVQAYYKRDGQVTARPYLKPAPARSTPSSASPVQGTDDAA